MTQVMLIAIEHRKVDFMIKRMWCELSGPAAVPLQQISFFNIPTQDTHIKNPIKAWKLGVTRRVDKYGRDEMNLNKPISLEKSCKGKTRLQAQWPLALF
jgi:hypothetical protein